MTRWQRFKRALWDFFFWEPTWPEPVPEGQRWTPITACTICVLEPDDFMRLREPRVR